MHRTYRGREITVTQQDSSCCTFTIGDGAPCSAAALVVSGVDPYDPAAVYDWLTSQIDTIDTEPVRPLMAAWWYAPGTVTSCSRGHTKAPDTACADSWCVRQERAAARRAARRTGITAASLAGVLTRAGHARAELRYDGTAKSVGFSCSGEQRGARVCVMWRDGLLHNGLAEQLHDIARTLLAKGYRVEVHPQSSVLRVYPKGSPGSEAYAYTSPAP